LDSSLGVVYSSGDANRAAEDIFNNRNDLNERGRRFGRPACICLKR